MVNRRGLGKGKGKGYKNIIGKDPAVHSQSAKGVKQPQRVKQTKFSNSIWKVGEERYFSNDGVPVLITKLNVPKGEKAYRVEEVGHIYKVGEEDLYKFKPIKYETYRKKRKKYETFRPDPRDLSGEEMETYGFI